MKRQSTSELSDAAPKRTPRQDPVSCNSCRRKKLKCNREVPCSSCVTRRLPCSYSTGAPSGIRPQRVAFESGSANSAVSLQETRKNGPVPLPRGSGFRSSGDCSEPLRTADWLETIVMGDRVPTAVPAAMRNELTRSRRDVIAPDSPVMSPGFPSSISLEPSTASDENPTTVRLISFLPRKSESLALFRYYLDYIDHLYPIIIPRRVGTQISDIYQSIEKNQHVDLNHLALLFSIIASSRYLQLSVELSPNAEVSSREYTFLAGAALIQANYTAYATVEGLQATMVVVHNISNLNHHPSVSALFSHGNIINQAKNMMMHCIDLPRYQEERKINEFDPVDIELKRRLWWDIVAYDWLLGFLSGPQEWTYLIHTNHTNVQDLSNIDDEALVSGDVHSQPISTPTVMSYSIQRLKLAFVCRDIVDTTAYEHLHGLEVSYDKILELDRKLHQAHSELPGFFHLDPASRRRFASLYQERPTLAWQRCLLQQGYHSRFCRLHREYFIRGAKDPCYSYSHVICLQSARKVIEIKRIMDEDEPRFAPPSSAIWSVMHHVFMAAVILLMDVCFNWDDILADKRRAEVLEVCRMLSKAQQSSSIVREGINAMMGVLQKHWKNGKTTPKAGNQTHPSSSPTFNPTSVEPSALTPAEAGHMSASVVEIKDSPMGVLGNNTITEAEHRHLEDIWIDMLDSGNNLEMDEDWTDLLADLTNTTLPCN